MGKDRTTIRFSDTIKPVFGSFCDFTEKFTRAEFWWLSAFVASGCISLIVVGINVDTLWPVYGTVPILYSRRVLTIILTNGSHQPEKFRG